MEIEGISRITDVADGIVSATYVLTGDSSRFSRGSGIFDSLSFLELAEMAVPGGSGVLRAAVCSGTGLNIHPGGWQSWSPGWELGPDDRIPGRVLGIRSLSKYIDRDGIRRGTAELIGHFVMYLRAGDEYLCIASLDCGSLPPVSFRIDRAGLRISLEARSPGKEWEPGEVVARLRIFMASGAFGLRDRLRSIYGSSDRFARVSFLGAGTGCRFAAAGYASWYDRYGDISEQTILEDLRTLDRSENLINRLSIRKGRPTVFQIDDGWELNIGDWEAKRDRFPGGMLALAAEIESRGYIPGLWLAPFVVTSDSALFREKKEWLLRDESGRPVAAGFNPRWNGTFYCLDLSRGEVAEHLRNVVGRIVDEWGFRYVKLDFLYAGMLEGVRAGGGAAFECYDRALRILTERTETVYGKSVAYLGCGAPLGPSYPYLSLMRIGTDTRESWDWLPGRLIRLESRPSAYVNLKDTIGRSFLDGTVFRNDPDVVFLRNRNCSLTDAEKELIALVDYLLASQLMMSDIPGDFWKAGGLTDRIIGLFEVIDAACSPDEEFAATRLEADCFRIESRSGRVAGVINLRSAPFDLERSADPSLYDAVAGGVSVVDRMLCDRKESGERGSALRFSPRSITIVTV